MTHEHHPDTPAEGRHRSADEETVEQQEAPTAAAIVEHAAESAPTPQIADAIRAGFTEHRSAFAGYLTLLPSTETHTADMVSDFLNVYISSYDNAESLVTDTIGSFDWPLDLDRPLAGNPLLRAVVTFDHQAVFSFVCDHFDVIYLDDHFHVYDR